MKKALIFIGLACLIAWSFLLLFLSPGWRGLLQKGLAFLGFRRSSRLMGFIWCLAHVSWILLGHSDPPYRVAGVLVMTLWSMFRRG